MCYIQFDYCCVSLGKEILVDTHESIGRMRELGFKSSKDGAQDNLGSTIVWRSVNHRYAVAGLQTQRTFRSIWRDMIDEHDTLKCKTNQSKRKNALFKRKAHHSNNKHAMRNDKTRRLKQKTLQLASSFALAWTCVAWCWRSGIKWRRIVSPVW